MSDPNALWQPWEVPMPLNRTGRTSSANFEINPLTMAEVPSRVGRPEVSCIKCIACATQMFFGSSKPYKILETIRSDRRTPQDMPLELPDKVPRNENRRFSRNLSHS